MNFSISVLTKADFGYIIYVENTERNINMFYWDWTFIILIPGLIISAIAQYKVSSTYSKYASMPAMCGVTGGEVARRILQQNGVSGVSVVQTGGTMSDHYDPRKGEIRLSGGVYGSASVASIAIAAHEAGLADIAYGAGMKITMYGNVACCEGVRGYAHMAAEAGLDELARKWRELADRLYGAIVDYFVKDGKWDLNNRGFYHDATLSTMSDISGYDASRDFDPKWYALSRDTYQEDRQDYIAPSMVGPRGVGYDHCIFTKNALLLDKVEDYTVLVENLCKMCYSPRLPDPYVVPECACYSPQKRLFRRQGDLGNLVHQSEAVHTLMTVVGLCQSSRGEVKWIPRLPKGWRVEVDDIPVPGREATARLKCGFPEHGEQRAELTVKGKGVEMLVRMGPFDKDSTLFCTVNGKDVPFEREIIGLSAWLRVKLEAKEKRYVILAREQ